MADQLISLQILDPAQGDLENIAQLYLSLAGQESSRKITNRIFNALEQLTRFPLSGSPMRDAELRNLEYRFLVVDKYILIYRYIGNSVIVYHIFDGRSDYPTLFRSELFK